MHERPSSPPIPRAVLYHFKLRKKSCANSQPTVYDVHATAERGTNARYGQNAQNHEHEHEQNAAAADTRSALGHYAMLSVWRRLG